MLLCNQLKQSPADVASDSATVADTTTKSLRCFPAALVDFITHYFNIFVSGERDYAVQIAASKDVLFSFNDVKAIVLVLVRKRLDDVKVSAQ